MPSSCCNMHRHYVHVQTEDDSTGNLYQLEPNSACGLFALCAHLCHNYSENLSNVRFVSMSQTEPTVEALTQELTFPFAIDRLSLSPLHNRTLGHRVVQAPSAFHKHTAFTLCGGA